VRVNSPKDSVSRGRCRQCRQRSGSREIVVRSKPEDRKVSGLWHFRLGAVEQRAIQSGSRNWVAAWRSSSWLLGSSRWDAAPSRSGAGARTASGKRRSAKNESLPPPIKDVAAADNGADNPLRSLPLFLAAQQSRLLPRFGGKATCLMAVGLSGWGVVALFASAALGWRFEAVLGVVVVE